MYLGATTEHIQEIVLYDNCVPYIKEVAWVPALYTVLREIVDNALDEIVGHGFGNRIDVSYDQDKMIFSVRDNGRGIPIDFDKDNNQYLATMVLTEPRAGRNFEERGNVVGTNGIGASAASNTAEWFKVEIHRGGKKFVQKYHEGNADATSLKIEDPKITNVKSDKSGTYIEFRPSSKVFPSMVLPEEFVKSRVTEVAICNPSLKIYYNGNQIKVKPKQEATLFPNKKPIVIDIKEGSLRSKFWVTYGNEGSEHIHTVVNNIPAFNGGVHVDMFKRTFYNGLINALARESKKRRLSPNRSDVQDGLFIYNITTMEAPNLDSQSKTRLINEEVAAIFKSQLENPDFYKDLIRKNPDWINAIFERCSARTMKKDASELAKLNKANKRLKVEELQDATGRDRSQCICIICEGKSALSGASEARNPEIHGALPLRGKVLNVYGKHLKGTAYAQHLKKVAENDALKKVASSLGLTVGQPADRKSMRYGQVYIATDADADGCLAPDTEVHTLKYGAVRIDQLRDRFGDEPFYVWSRDENGVQRPGLAHSPRITKSVKKLYRITLDNGKHIDATANHPFMMKDGSYRRADELSMGDSLSPFNYKNSKHQILSVEIIETEEATPVWDLTVDKYHNFALSNGCYVHNSNIAALMINYFYQLWPNLFDPKQKPIISIFQTPYIIAVKGKVRKYWYSDNFTEFKPEDYKGWEITVAKGLGSLQREDWDAVLKNPKLIPIVDDGDLEECLDLLFSPDADKRKEWLSE